MNFLTSIVLDFSKAWWVIVILSAVISLCMCKLAIIDQPNKRSSHAIATPKCGGVAFVLPLALLFFVMSFYEPFVFFTFLPSFVMAFIGFWDDHHDINWRWRFGLQLLLSVWVSAVIVFGAGSKIGWPLEAQIFFFFIGTFWLLYLTNIYNFMDGINGLAAIEAIIVCLFFISISLKSHSFVTYIFIYYMLFGISGFLIFNFPKAKLFMGDVGSQFLGFMFGTLGLLIAVIYWPYFFVMPLLLFNFIFDAGWTLSSRFVQKKNIFQAHKEHLYQKLVQSGWEHWQVTLLNAFFVFFQGSLFLLGDAIWYLRGWEGLWLFIPASILQGVYVIYVYCQVKRRENV